LFVDDSHRLTFDFAAADPARLAITTASGTVDEYLFAGPRMADVLDRYTRLTGRPALPPRWALGFHQSRWGYYPAAQVEETAAGLRARNIPADGLWLDIQHLDGFRSFTWDTNGFPDPAGLIASLLHNGFKTTVIVDPGIKVDPAWDVYNAGMQANAFLTQPDGSIYVGNAWPGSVAFPDFSATPVRAWWSELIARPLALGVRGLWIDMNEPTNTSGPPLPEALPAAGDGMPTTMAELHNAYALLEAEATWDGMRKAAPTRRPFIVSRAGFAGLQRYAGIWTGDAPSDFATLAETPAMMTGVALSGVPIVGSDVGGYSGHATAELYARWIELGSLSPFFRAHVTRDVPGQEPWMFGEEVEAVSRAVIGERYTLLPYWYGLAAAAAATGAPLLRPLVYEFPSDAGSLAAPDEVMVGPSLLYAPGLTAGATTRAVYLPPGPWYELRSGTRYAGGATITRPVSLAELPAFVRGGAILPRGPLLQWSDQAPLDPLTLDVWPDDAPTSFALFEDEGDGPAPGSTVTYAQAATATGARVSASPRNGSWVPPVRTIMVRFHGAGAAPAGARLDGVAVPLSYDGDDATISVAFADRAPWTLEVDYDRAAAVAAMVRIPVRVVVPAGATSPIAIATSVDGWTQQPLTWAADGSATGTISAPRGAWVYYKYTRGDWSTVEKNGDCSERPNRYVLAAAHPGAEDVVLRWADDCH
ncbi:MAG: glycoside hydrolase family 31 protein, partial [Polyangia bacterium]